jgi:hypothetical protein
MEISRRAGRIIVGTPERILAARDAWLAAMAALEVYRLEVNRLWLEYLALADPVRARKIRRILKHAEQGAAKTADELFPPAFPWTIDTMAERAAACTFAQSSARRFNSATRRR